MALIRGKVAALSIALLVSAAGVVAAVILTRDTPPTEPARPSPSSTASDGLSPAIVYMSDLFLRRSAILERVEQELAELPTGNAHASTGTEWIAYIASSAPESVDDDFVSEPELRLLDPTSKEEIVLGPGVSPLWSHDGQRVAYLRPIEPRRCFGEACGGNVEVAVYDVEARQDATRLPPGRWSLLAWVGDDLLLSVFGEPESTTVATASGDQVELGLPPGEVWDGSPDGKWVIRSAPGDVRLVPYEDGSVVGKGQPIPVDGLLAEGAWAHDGMRLAAVVLHPSGASTDLASRVAAILGGASQKAIGEVESILGLSEKKIRSLSVKNPRRLQRLVSRNRAAIEAALGGLVDPSGPAVTSDLVYFSVEDPTPVEVLRSGGATGTPLWSRNDRAVGFAALIDPKKGILQAKYCPLSRPGNCRTLFSWSQGITLLRLE